MIKTISYESINAGASLGIIGAVHGNEKCGSIAINQIINELDNGYIKLKQGKLHLMPIANPKAYSENMRFIERNLNRYLYKKQVKQYYEDHLDSIICDFIDKSDFLLDLHSYASDTKIKHEAFVFLSGRDKHEIEYAKNLGIKNFIYGWQQAFQNSENKEDKLESQGTTEYARLNNIVAVTLECGQHLSQNAPRNAYLAIINSLIYFDMLDTNCQAYIDNQIQNNNASVDDLLCIHMQDVYYRNAGDKLFQNWGHFDKIKQNQILAYRNNGDIIQAKQDGYILLPKLNASAGTEWFYFGVQDNLILNT